jgi:spore maturation protein CgeB
MKILYTGPLSPGETCEMRRQTLERLGHQTIPVDYKTVFKPYSGLKRKIQWRLRTGPMISSYNQLIIEMMKEYSPEMFWVDKGMFVWSSTLEFAKRNGVRFFVHYSPDNYFLKQNSSRHFWKGLPLYDVVVTTKTFNLSTLRQRGAKLVFLSGNAFDPTIHRPVALTAEEQKEFGCDVSFVGRWEPDREKLLERVAKLGTRLHIWGTGWKYAKSYLIKKACRLQPVLGDDYAKAICASKISLGLLSKLARDLITQRSVEIPACGGFMLAERTEEHLAHFSENLEAAYFGDAEEMCQKIEYYLNHEQKREKIAMAGRTKCLEAGFSYDERIRQILEVLGI